MLGSMMKHWFQFMQKLPWINLDLGTLGKMQIDYFVGIDGLSVALVVMSSVVMVIAALASWEITATRKGFLVCCCCSIWQ